MFKRYILFIFDKLNLYITKLAAYLNNPFLCYLSILISIKRHNFFIKKRKKNILVLYRSLGIFDLEKFNEIKKINSLFIIERAHFKIIFDVFLKDKKQLLSDNNYLTTNPIIEYRKKEYRNFLFKIFFYLNKKYNFSSILSFNFRYYAERELHFAAKQNNIKFVCYIKRV